MDFKPFNLYRFYVKALEEEQENVNKQRETDASYNNIDSDQIREHINKNECYDEMDFKPIDLYRCYVEALEEEQENVNKQRETDASYNNIDSDHIREHIEKNDCYDEMDFKPFNLYRFYVEALEEEQENVHKQRETDASYNNIDFDQLN